LFPQPHFNPPQHVVKLSKEQKMIGVRIGDIGHIDAACLKERHTLVDIGK
jgi:hypothetical protein